MRNLVCGAFAAIAMGTAAVSAQAADLGSIKGPPPPPVYVEPFHPFQVRLKVGAVVPLDGTATIYDRGGPGATYTNALGVATNETILQFLRYSNGANSVFQGAGTSISPSIQPMLDVTWYLTRNWAIEAICCVSNHHVTGTGSIAGSSVIKSWVFPPSVMLQYHFTNFGAFQPYLGVGVNFTTFWGTRPGNHTFPFFSPRLGATGFNTAYAATVTPSWGVVGQAGADYMLNDRWGVNVDVKYIMMEPNAHVWAVNTGTAAVGGIPLFVPLNLAVKINPIVVSAGLTYRFGADWGIPKILPF